MLLEWDCFAFEELNFFAAEINFVSCWSMGWVLVKKSVHAQEIDWRVGVEDGVRVTPFGVGIVGILCHELCCSSSYTNNFGSMCSCDFDIGPCDSFREVDTIVEAVVLVVATVNDSTLLSICFFSWNRFAEDVVDV